MNLRYDVAILQVPDQAHCSGIYRGGGPKYLSILYLGIHFGNLFPY